MIFSQRQLAKHRTQALMALAPVNNTPLTFTFAEKEIILAPTAWLKLQLFQAGLGTKPFALTCLCALSAIASTVLLSQILTVQLLPLFSIAGAMLPPAWVRAKANKRALEFLEDYPSVLLATASSLKVGLTAYAALERSVKLLPIDSLVRKEVEILIADLRRGVAKNLAVERFAASINLPDLELFRSAFALVLEQGGRFGPTLERLANVAKDRTNLISSAKVSTTNMRMTANILLGISPLLICLVAFRTVGYWDNLINHPVANSLASIGICIIAGSYIVLRTMSNFKP